MHLKESYGQLMHAKAVMDGYLEFLNSVAGKMGGNRSD